MFDHLLEPLSYVLDPSKRVFWAYVVGALIVACVVTARAQGYLDIAAQLRSLFSGRYWFNRSTSLDYLLLFVNGTIRTLLIIPVLGSHLAGAFVVASFLQRNVADPAVVRRLLGLQERSQFGETQPVVLVIKRRRRGRRRGRR